MADETDQHDDVLDLTEDQELPAEQQQEEAHDEFHLELEGEEAHEETPAIREMRQRLRDQARELDGYRKQTAPKKVEVGPRPTLEASEYDEDRFASELDAYNERKRQNEQADKEAQQKQEVANEQLRRAEADYRGKVARLGIASPAYQEAENTVVAQLPPIVVSNALKHIADLPKVVLALHKYPATLARVAAEPDPLTQLMMLKDMQSKIKTGDTVVRKAPPPPEADTIQRGTVSNAPLNKAAQDKKYKQLEEEARATGKRDKFIAYKEELAKKDARK